MSNTYQIEVGVASKAEQVNPTYNPDYKEIFDCGPNIFVNHQFQDLPYYSKNIWPKNYLCLKKIMSFINHAVKFNINLKQIEISLKLLSIIILQISSNYLWHY